MQQPRSPSERILVAGRETVKQLFNYVTFWKNGLAAHVQDACACSVVGCLFIIDTNKPVNRLPLTENRTTGNRQPATGNRLPTPESILFLRFRQLARRIIWLAVQFLHLLHKVRPVIALGVRERPRLAFVVPAFRVESLRLLVMLD
jgi:hypothetical protein